MIITSEHISKASLEEAGGKGYNLLLLKKMGFTVPDFIIVPVSYLHHNKPATALMPEILKVLPAAEKYAVRSSATSEDSESHSFAGQFDTLLNVTVDELPNAIEKVLASAKRIPDAYKQHAETQEIKMAVIIQAMVDATCSGVAFGIDPITGNKKHTIINAVSGTGEKLVDGSENSDTYTFEEGSVISGRIIGESPVLNEFQLKTIADTVRELSIHFNHPQDIEFAFKGEEFFLLQSRPVTTQNKGERIVWDNSNIIESYPGLTLPLTFSFIEKMYAAVYKQLSVVLGVSPKKVKKYDNVYNNMLGLINGRVYYNLNSWYSALSLLPGYALNASFMEKMMGVKEKADVKLYTDEGSKNIADYLQLITALNSIVKNLRSVRKQKDHFVHEFNKVYKKYAGRDYSNNSLADIYRDYAEFEEMMVTRWKAPLVNDFFAMIYYGVLQKLCTKYAPATPDLHNKLVASSGDIITTEPMKRLPVLAAVLSKNKELSTALSTQPPLSVWQLLKSGKYDNELQAIEEYLSDWGERCMAELKLETITYNQAPEKLMAVLQHYHKNNIYSYNEDKEAGKQKKDAEAIVNNALKGHPVKKRIFGHVLKKARYLVANRENLRYYRTRGFGVVRHMMTAMGMKMKESGVLANERDIFYLKLDEIATIANGSAGFDTQQVISKRKDEYKLYDNLYTPERIETYGKHEKVLLQDPGYTVDNQQELTGIASSPGIVQGKVCKVANLEDRFPDDEILVTYATDPGYVVMFPSSKAIITERGSLLSHAAIVSREMNIPCIVGVDNVMDQLKTGDEILMDGSTGIIKILRRSHE